MSVASYMDFRGHSIVENSTVMNGAVEVEYRVKYNAPWVTARVEWHVDEPLFGDIHFRMVDAGRKLRNTKADQERVFEVVRVARNWWRRWYEAQRG